MQDKRQQTALDSMVCMQIPVDRPSHLETTSLGAALAAGIGVGFWSKDWVFDSKQKAAGTDAKTWQPEKTAAEVDAQYKKWKKAVSLSFGLADLDEADQAATPVD